MRTNEPVVKESIPDEKTTRSEGFPSLPVLLSYLYKPLQPLTKRINIRRAGRRKFNPRDVLLPDGYTIELVADGFDAPVSCCFDDQGNCYVVESGHKVTRPPSIVRVDTRTGRRNTYYRLMGANWHQPGAMTGAVWRGGDLYVMNTDTLFRILPGGMVEEVVTGLPGLGDHQANHPVLGPDGAIYWGQGCVTNCGVVGADNFAFEWLPKHPQFCDVPAQDIRLVGTNFETQNVLGSLRDTARTGAYSPYGKESQPGQVVPGSNKASGAVLRWHPEEGEVRVVAWGLRNPYGLAFHPDGRLFVTEHGMDERGSRFIRDDPDDFYEIHEGEWYGWPDFASGIRLDDPHWGEGGRGREPVLAEFPNPNPPKPFASFYTHAAANGFDFSPGGEFGFEGDAFVACFGDLAPITTVTKATYPAGFNVVRVDMATGKVEDFAVNRTAGPASKLPHSGFERPSHCKFGPDGALYVVDYGEIKIAPEKGAIRMKEGTGALWRIRKTGEPALSPLAKRPVQPRRVPLYLLQFGAVLGGVVGVVLAVNWLVKRIRRE